MFDSPVTVYAGQEIFYEEVGLEDGTYWYRVKASNECCDSDWTEGSHPLIISPPCECDLNNDGRCDMQDWLKFGEDWGRTDCGTPPGSGNPPNDCECDLNHDGRCDMQDWLLFGEDWGRTDCPVQE